MKKILFALVISGLPFIGCSLSQREVSLRDVTQSETVILTKKPGQGAVTGFRIAGRGAITGKAEVQLILNGAVYKKEEISGRTQFEWSGDWYADQAEVRYIPGTASGGTLTLKHAFNDL